MNEGCTKSMYTYIIRLRKEGESRNEGVALKALYINLNRGGFL